MKARLLVTVAYLAWAPLACSGDRSLGGDGGALPAGDASNSCSSGQTRCVGTAYQACQSGRFATIRDCSGESCSETLGCVACDPALKTICKENDVYGCNADGTIGALAQKCWTSPCHGGACTDPGCAPESQQIYVVDTDYRLLSFSPAGGAHTFKLIGKLNCPAGASLRVPGQQGTPFSMSVDRQAKAWILYDSGEIFWASTTDASCQGTAYPKGQGGFELFGMGFVSDSAGANAEKLFIAGGQAMDIVGGNIGRVDPATLTVTTVGPIPKADYSPELTGTGKADLFGYFPGVNTFVAQLDRSTGSILHQWTLPALTDPLRAWAFAHWGGRFYIFVTTQDVLGTSTNSQVLRLDPTNGTTDTILSKLEYVIVGAGVSTCVPTGID
jgi:hypothetical protein